MNNLHYNMGTDGVGLLFLGCLQTSSRVRARLARRQISVSDISIVYLCGVRRRARGAVRYFLRKRDIAHFADHELAARIIGLTVVLSTDEHTLITAYKRRVKKRYSHGGDARVLRQLYAPHNLDVKWWRYHFPDLEFIPVKYRPQYRH